MVEEVVKRIIEVTAMHFNLASGFKEASAAESLDKESAI